MALSNDNLITLEGNAAFRKIAAFEFFLAFQELHRNIPVRGDFSDDTSYNKKVDDWTNIVSVKPTMERSVESDGKLDITATKHLIAAISTYENIQVTPLTQDNGESDPDFEARKAESLIQDVLNYAEENKRIIETECTKILKGYSFKPEKVVIPA